MNIYIIYNTHNLMSQHHKYKDKHKHIHIHIYMYIVSQAKSEELRSQQRSGELRIPLKQ